MCVQRLPCFYLHLSWFSNLRLLVAQAPGDGTGMSEVVFTGSGDASNVEATLTSGSGSTGIEDAIVVLT